MLRLRARLLGEANGASSLMKRFALWLFLVKALYATVNEPLRWEVFTGYRNDRIHWHIQDPGDRALLNLSERYRDVAYLLNGLSFKVIHRDLSFFLRGSYGVFGSGSLVRRFPQLPEDPHIHLKAKSWAADVSGYFGYAVNLTADRTYKLILTPLLGYLGYFEQLDRSPGGLRLTWNGFFLGGQLVFETGGPIMVTTAYAYNIVHNKVRAQLPEGFLKTSSGGNKGQTGWAQIDWNFSSCWRVGLGADIRYFTSRVVDASISEKGREDLNQKFKLRWNPVSGWVQLSRTF